MESIRYLWSLLTTTVYGLVSDKKFNCTGGTTYSLGSGFVFLDEDELTVIRVDAAGVRTELALTTDYTVSGGAGASGTITTVATYNDGHLIVYRDTDRVQEYDARQGDGFNTDTFEQQLDRMMMVIQEAHFLFSNSLRFDRFDDENFDPILPPVPAAIAGKALKINDAGNGFDWSDYGIDDAVSLAEAAKTNAEAAASAASTSESNAATSETNAANSASAAAGSASAAATEVTYAAEWANKAEDSLVSAAAGGDEVDDYSSFHWAQKANSYASAAAAAITFENLNANGDVGTGADQVAQGNHGHADKLDAAGDTVTGELKFSDGTTDIPGAKFSDDVNNSHATLDVAGELFRILNIYRGAAEGLLASFDLNTKQATFEGTLRAVAQLECADWSIRQSSGALIFSYLGTDKMKLDTSGNLTVTGNVTAYGTI